jgi:hypothetical protein
MIKAKVYFPWLIFTNIIPGALIVASHLVLALIKAWLKEGKLA